MRHLGITFRYNLRFFKIKYHLFDQNKIQIHSETRTLGHSFSVSKKVGIREPRTKTFRARGRAITTRPADLYFEGEIKTIE